MNNDRLNPKSQGANSPRNPRQNTPLISDGSPTKGSVTGHDPAKQTKQQTAQMPMNSTIAAQKALESIDGGAIRSTQPNSFITKHIGTFESAARSHFQHRLMHSVDITALGNGNQETSTTEGHRDHRQGCGHREDLSVHSEEWLQAEQRVLARGGPAENTMLC